MHFGGGQQETLLEGCEEGLGLPRFQKLVHFRYEMVLSQNEMHLGQDSRRLHDFWEKVNLKGTTKPTYVL